jgi:hypothetical protein
MSGVDHNWTAAEDALLGTMIDREVARRIGLTPLSVLNRRKKLGISAARPTRPSRPPKIKSKPIGKMKPRDYVKAANRARAKLGGRKPKRRKKPQPARPLPKRYGAQFTPRSKHRLRPWAALGLSKKFSECVRVESCQVKQTSLGNC